MTGTSAELTRDKEQQSTVALRHKLIQFLLPRATSLMSPSRKSPTNTTVGVWCYQESEKERYLQKPFTTKIQVREEWGNPQRCLPPGGNIYKMGANLGLLGLPICVGITDYGLLQVLATSLYNLYNFCSINI